MRQSVRLTNEKDQFYIKYYYRSARFADLSRNLMSKNYDERAISANTATIDDLKSLQMISDDIAHKIIAYRQKIGGYTSVEQIMQIDGIGQITFNNISPFLTVGG